MPTKSMELEVERREMASNASLSAYGKARSTVPARPSGPMRCARLDAYWRACNYLASV